MQYRISELYEFIKSDPEVRILIVEGRSDIEFWKSTMPHGERANCVIYSVDEIELIIGEGGNKGAALSLAVDTLNWEGGDRIHYFLDADNDNLLGRTYGRNVTLTDYPDVEGYVLVDEIFRRLCRDGANENPREISITSAAVYKTVREVGILRVASARENLCLPFQSILINGSLSRFFKKKRREFYLSLDPLLDALCASGGTDRKLKANVLRLFKVETDNQEGIAIFHIVHGKDLISFLFWYFEVSLDIANGMIKLAIAAEIERVRCQPRLNSVVQWAKAS